MPARLGPKESGTECSNVHTQQPLVLGAEVILRSHWANMNERHYVAYFSVPDLVLMRVLLNGVPLWVEKSTCNAFNHGSTLHITAPSRCLGGAKCLLEHCANPTLWNRKGQLPAEVVPAPMDMPLRVKAEASTGLPRIYKHCRRRLCHSPGPP